MIVREAAEGLVLLAVVTATLALGGCGDAEAPGASSAVDSEPRLRDVGPLETVARLDVAPGNVTVTPKGAIIVSLHQHFSPELRAARVVDGERLEPFPNAAWNDQSRPADERLDSVLGIQSDPEGIVWMLDNGMRGGVTPKLVAWNTRSDALERVIELPLGVTREGSFVNDLAVDTTHGAIYIADPASGADAALIVVDLESGKALRVLEGHESVVPEDIDLIIDGEPVEVRRPDGSTVRPRIGVNPICLDTRNEYLYYGPMHARSLYRVPTSALLAVLRPERTGEESLAAQIERYGDKPISDGSSMNDRDEVYITAIGDDAIGVTRPDGSYEELFRDEARLSWPDAFSFGPDGHVYVVANQLHRGPVLNAGENASEPPYLILRFDPAASGVVGR